MLPYFGDSIAGQTSRMPQSRARGSVLATCSRVEGPREGYIEIFAAHLVTPSRVRLSVAKNTQQIFQNFRLEVFWQVKLVTVWRLTSVTKISWFAKRSSFSTLFSKRVLIFFLASCDSSFFGLTFNISTLPWSIPKSSAIFSPFSQSSGKDWECLHSRKNL